MQTVLDQFTDVLGDKRGFNPQEKDLPYWGGSGGGILFHIQGIENGYSAINATEALKTASQVEDLTWAYDVLDSVKNGKQGVVCLNLYSASEKTLEHLRKDGWIVQGLADLACLKDATIFDKDNSAS